VWAHLLPSTASQERGEARSSCTFRALPSNSRWPRRIVAIPPHSDPLADGLRSSIRILAVLLTLARARLLQEILEGDLRRLAREITHTDHRGMKEGLRTREARSQGVVQKRNTDE